MSLIDWLIGVNSTFNTSRLYRAIAEGLEAETDGNIKKKKRHSLSLCGANLHTTDRQRVFGKY